MAQDCSPLEIVVVDNASTDDSPRRIAAAFPEVRVVQLTKNTGYANGMNEGIMAVLGDFVALLNLDVSLQPEYLRLCVEALVANPKLGGVTGKLLKPGGKKPPIIDSTGHLVFASRRAVDRGEHELDQGQYDQSPDVFSVCGAAPVYRRKMLDDVKLQGQYFDEDFFAYFEDFDISWRAKLKGWDFAFVPEAVGRHYRGASGGKTSTFVLACNHRNRWLVMLRNDDRRSFLKHLGTIAYTELRATGHMLKLRPAAIPLAWRQFLKLLPNQLKKRKAIQQGRAVDWRDLEKWFAPYSYGLHATLERARKRGAAH